MALSVHGNRNRNDFYNNPTYRDLATVSRDFDQNPTWTRPTPVNGTVQNESSPPTSTSLGVRINPSDTANIRAQLSLGLTDRVRFTFDPSYQYVLANGGGYTTVAESNGRLRLFQPRVWTSTATVTCSTPSACTRPATPTRTASP